MNEAITESLAELAPRMSWASPPPTMQDSEEAVRRFAAGFMLRTSLHFLVLAEGKALGICTLSAINWAIPSAAMGYWIRTSESGRGYMTEAANALALYAFRVLGLRRLTLSPEEGNTKSAGIAERLGFTLEGTAKNSGTWPHSQELRTSRLYARFNADGLDNTGVSWGA